MIPIPVLRLQGIYLGKGSFRAKQGLQLKNKAKRFGKQQQSNVEMLWLAYIAISCEQSKLVEEIIQLQRRVVNSGGLL